MLIGPRSLGPERKDHEAAIEALREALVLGSQDKEGFLEAGRATSQPEAAPDRNDAGEHDDCACLALDSLDNRRRKGDRRSRQGPGWLKKTPPNGKDPAVSSEWYTLRLLMEKKFGEPKQVEALRDQILPAQQSDGGWGWLWADKSDAFGTGLAFTHWPGGSAQITTRPSSEAWKFLIETQTDNGSWIVNGTKDAPRKAASLQRLLGLNLGLARSVPVAPRLGHGRRAVGRLLERRRPCPGEAAVVSINASNPCRSRERQHRCRAAIAESAGPHDAGYGECYRRAIRRG